MQPVPAMRFSQEYSPIIMSVASFKYHSDVSAVKKLEEAADFAEPNQSNHHSPKRPFMVRHF